MISPYRTFVEAYPFTLILHMRGQQKRATVTGDASGIERGSINFAVRRIATVFSGLATPALKTK